MLSVPASSRLLILLPQSLALGPDVHRENLLAYLYGNRGILIEGDCFLPFAPNNDSTPVTVNRDAPALPASLSPTAVERLWLMRPLCNVI